MPDRLPSLIVLVGFWIPPAVAGWAAAGFLQRSTERGLAKKTYAVLTAFVLGYAAAWFLFNLGRMPPYIPGATTDPTFASPRAVAGLAIVASALVLPGSALACVWRFAAVCGCSEARLVRVRQLSPPMKSTAARSNTDPRVTIHMVASLDGFIARKDGSVDWLETSDEFVGGDTMDPGAVEAFLKTIDCYVMGSRTYETALGFEAKGFGWAYGDKPTFVLTRRALPRTRETVEFYSGDLAQFVNERLRPRFRSIWFVGGGVVSGECLRLGLADEVRYSILPILIGDGIPFFEKLGRDVALHLAEVKPYKNGMVELRYEVRGHRSESRNAT